MSGPEVYRDERTVAIENASYRIAYLVLTYGLLIVVVYRSFVLDQQSWDLLALVMLGSLITTVYQGFSQVLTRRWGQLAVVAFLGAVIIAVVLMVTRG